MEEIMDDPILKRLPILQTIIANNPGWLDEAVTTEEATKITGVPVATLVTLRSRGGGPNFLKPSGTRLIRYFRRSLYEWLGSGGIKESTCDPGFPQTQNPAGGSEDE